MSITSFNPSSNTVEMGGDDAPRRTRGSCREVPCRALSESTQLVSGWTRITGYICIVSQMKFLSDTKGCLIHGRETSIQSWSCISWSQTVLLAPCHVVFMTLFASLSWCGINCRFDSLDGLGVCIKARLVKSPLFMTLQTTLLDLLHCLLWFGATFLSGHSESSTFLDAVLPLLLPGLWFPPRSRDLKSAAMRGKTEPNRLCRLS